MSLDIVVPVQLMFRVSDDFDPDVIDKMVESYLEHGSHRDGIQTALGESDFEYDGYHSGYPQVVDVEERGRLWMECNHSPVEEVAERWNLPLGVVRCVAVEGP